jgi:hypothetical protein
VPAIRQHSDEAGELQLAFVTPRGWNKNNARAQHVVCQIIPEPAVDAGTRTPRSQTQRIAFHTAARTQAQLTYV